jgi:hypothetical protein
VLALAGAIYGLTVVASGKWTLNNFSGGNDGLTASKPPQFPQSDYAQRRFPRPAGRPLIGVNYTHYAFPNCTFHQTYILSSYQQPKVAKRVHSQLFQMRKAGLRTIRTIIWHLTDASNQEWGPISSAGGRLREPYRTNLMHYLREIRRFGFARFTVAFGPRGTNNPLRTRYDSAKFHENWRFIKTVRSLVKRYGPAETRIDLFSEGAPNETPTRYEPVPQQTADYLRRMYRLYVSRFGNRDVSVSVIAPLYPGDMTNRLGNLIRILQSSRARLPRWYDVHIGFNPVGASHALRQTEAVLRMHRQRQRLVIGDAGYDNPGIAKAIEGFLQKTSRPIEEVSPWYTRTRLGCQVPPPYTPGAYGRELASRSASP